MTLPQVHAATNAVIAALPLPPETRHEKLDEAARKLEYWQTRNAQARASHTQTRIRLLKDLGYPVDNLPRCVPG